MKPIKFRGANVEFVGQKGDLNPMPAFLDADGIAVTCWELSAEELKQILNSGKLYICTNTLKAPLQPYKVSVFKSDFLINVIDN